MEGLNRHNTMKKTERQTEEEKEQDAVGDILFIKPKLHHPGLRQTAVKLILTALAAAMIKTAAASAPGLEMDIKSAFHTLRSSGCHQFEFGVTKIPTNISTNTQCL